MKISWLKTDSKKVISDIRQEAVIHIEGEQMFFMDGYVVRKAWESRTPSIIQNALLITDRGVSKRWGPTVPCSVT